jgi:hypothetical protein
VGVVQGVPLFSRRPEKLWCDSGERSPDSLSYLSFLDRLLGAEAGARRERAVARRIRDARFPENKTLDTLTCR